MSLLLLRVDTSRRAGRPPSGEGISGSHYAHESRLAQGSKSTEVVATSHWRPLPWLNSAETPRQPALSVGARTRPSEQTSDPDASSCVMVLDRTALQPASPRPRISASHAVPQYADQTKSGRHRPARAAGQRLRSGAHGWRRAHRLPGRGSQSALCDAGHTTRAAWIDGAPISVSLVVQHLGQRPERTLFGQLCPPGLAGAAATGGFAARAALRARLPAGRARLGAREPHRGRTHAGATGTKTPRAARHLAAGGHLAACHQPARH